MKQKLLLFLSVLLTTAGAWAQAEQGKYYRIVNARYNKVMKENWGNQDVTCNALDNEDYAQIWMYTTTGALQNVYTGRYLQNQPNTSNTFKTGQESVAVSFTTQSDGHLGINVSGNQLHCDASSNVVRWNDNGNEGNHWTVQAVSLTAEEVQAVRDEFQALSGLKNNAGQYSEALKTFFANEICTELKAEYAAKSDDELKAAMAEAGLPTMLQEIAVKIKNQWWNETDKSAYADKNQYAKDFRVATFKPYSDANRWREKMNTYAPSFMGNPTGIYAKNKDVIHVFVGNDIPEGATLYLTPIRNHGRIGDRYEGTELKKGYNAVITTTDSVVYFVNYVVSTIPTSNVNAHTKTIAKISDFPDLDIHIEGGQCVGYYQKPAENSAEEDAKYQYLIQNANAGMYFMVKGETSLFYFKKYTYTKHFPNTIWNSINWFDRLQFWEFAVIGVLDDVANGKCENGTEYSKAAYPLNIKGGDAFFPTYCNNPSMAMEGPGGQNPHATTFYTSYPGDGGVESSFNAERANFDNWCAGHEHGHQMQGAYNLESCSESSVNLPSNIITYLTGYRLSRGWNFAQNYAYVAENKPFGLRDISITMRMYYNLFLYYHIGGKKKDFYPTFVKSLREDPMDFSKDGVQYQHPEWGKPNGGHHRAVNTWIKFYKKACDAAQEDLTEYFRLWGFFVPCDKEYFGDYTSYAVSLTQKEIDDAIAEVKAKGYPENLQIMFVEDRQIPRERTDIWAHTATGTQKYKPTNWEAWYTEDQLKKEYGDVGDILTYIDGSANTSEYTYTQSANKISLKGRGGVGFIVYDLEGNNRYMSNCLEFEIPVELVLNGYEIRSINADGTSNTVGADAETDYEQLNGMLETLLSEAQEIIDITITENSYCPGFYYVDSEISEFNRIYNYAKNIYDTKKQTSYQDAYLYLKQAMEDVKNNASTLPFVPNSTYVLTNKKYSGKSMDLNESGALCAAATDLTKASQQWVMESATEKDTYYIKNKSTGKYLGTLNRSVQISANEETQSSAKAYKLYNLGNALWALQCQTDKDQMSLHTDGGGKVVGWSHTASYNDGSWWYLTATSVDEDNLMLGQLETLVKQTQELISLVGGVPVGKTTLSTTAGSTFCLTDNNGKSEGSLENLLDGNTDTYYVSNWGGEATQASYLQVETAETSALSKFQFSYTTRKDGGAPVPSEIVVSASEDGNSFTTLQTFTKEAHALPAASDASEWTTPVLGDGTKAYRYLRFTVTKSYRSNGGEANGKGVYHYGISEFALINSAVTSKDEYASIDQGLLASAQEALQQAQKVLADATTQEYAAALAALQAQYEALLAAKEQADNADVAGKKQQLLDLINETKTLMESCGTVTFTEDAVDVKVTLQTSDAAAVAHLSTNAEEPKEGKLEYLLDGDKSTYFHSAWSQDINDVHHLKIYASEEETMDSVIFSYQSNKGPFPYEIKVYGATEKDGTYNLFRTFSKDDATNPLPTEKDKEWTSDAFAPTGSYKYLRFDVTNSGAQGLNATPEGEYCFVMSEFALTRAGSQEKYSVQLKDNVGNVTEELLIATYKEVEKAQMVYDMATTEAQVLAAIGSLQEQYDTLLNAKYVDVKVSQVALDKTEAKLIEGESLTLTATVTPHYAYNRKVSWSSSNTAVATVDANGLVKAIAPGTAVITAKAGDKSAICALTVEKKVIPVGGISLSQTSATLVEGESLTLTATVTPADATDKTVTWSSSNTAITTVDASGLVKAIAPGTAVITAKAGDKSATCTLTVEKKVIPVEGITLSHTSATLVEGESLTLSATVTPADATDKTVTWSSSNTAVATVDATGRVKAIAPGTAVITAKAGDKSATCALTVEKKVIPVSGITLSHTSATLVEGESLTLTATVTPADATDKTVTWSSSNTAVATVDATGRVKAIAPGTAVITAKAGDKSATCTLTVEKKVIPVSGITLSHTSATLVEGESLTLSATVTPADATDKTVTWSSSDETVATVDANGKVVAIAPGTAVITAQAGDFTATCEIVVSAIDSIEDLKALGDNVVVYDLEGRRIFDVDNLKPGLYIVNGKRVLIGKRVN